MKINNLFKFSPHHELNKESYVDIAEISTICNLLAKFDINGAKFATVIVNEPTGLQTNAHTDTQTYAQN